MAQFRWTRGRVDAIAQQLLLAGCLAFGTAGCQTFEPVDIHTDRGLAVLDAGDHVRVETIDAQRHSFGVTYAARDVVAGDGVRLTRGRVESVMRKEEPGAATWIVGPVLVIGWVAYAVGSALGAALVFA